jgi:hypothetical protein
VTIASGYATTIYRHGPVKMLADGTIGAAAAGEAFVGVLMGVEYRDSTGKPCGGHWPASTVATDIVAYITRDPNIIYEIQASATLSQTHVGNLVDLGSAGSGNAALGVSTATADAATAGTASAQLQILGFQPAHNNVPGDAYPILQVRIAEHQLSGWDSAGTYAADAGV